LRCHDCISEKTRWQYEVARFVKSHTHELTSPSKTHLLRSNREVSDEVRSKLFACHKAMIGTSAAFRLLSVEMGGHENIGCTKKDAENYDRDCKKALVAGMDRF
jgi:hypothetical protein